MFTDAHQRHQRRLVLTELGAQLEGDTIDRLDEERPVGDPQLEALLL
ncbi:MAG TPA: hypothetical protein QF572_11280 [Vicinamibacterales bacterium]|nr:hypothetical protein [Vicinamibacterales bacterium]